MTELARFRPAAARHQHPFVFERASLALLANWRQRILSHHLPTTALPLDSEWRDPILLRLGVTLSRNEAKL
jgi:hypothetical protein